MWAASCIDERIASGSHVFRNRQLSSGLADSHDLPHMSIGFCTSVRGEPVGRCSTYVVELLFSHTVVLDSTHPSTQLSHRGSNVYRDPGIIDGYYTVSLLDSPLHTQAAGQLTDQGNVFTHASSGPHVILRLLLAAMDIYRSPQLY